MTLGEEGVGAERVIGGILLFIGIFMGTKTGIEEGGGRIIDFPLFCDIFFVLFGVYILFIVFILMGLKSYTVGFW